MKAHTTHHDGCACFRDRVIDEVVAALDVIADDALMRRNESATEERYQDAARYAAQVSAIESAIYRVKKMKEVRS